MIIHSFKAELCYNRNLINSLKSTFESFLFGTRTMPIYSSIVDKLKRDANETVDKC